MITADKVRYLTHPQATKAESATMRLMVKAINLQGRYQMFDVVIPVAIAYGYRQGAQQTLNSCLTEKWDVLTATPTGDRF